MVAILTVGRLSHSGVRVFKREIYPQLKIIVVLLKINTFIYHLLILRKLVSFLHEHCEQQALGSAYGATGIFVLYSLQ